MKTKTKLNKGQRVSLALILIAMVLIWLSIAVPKNIKSDYEVYSKISKRTVIGTLGKDLADREIKTFKEYCDNLDGQVMNLPAGTKFVVEIDNTYEMCDSNTVIAYYSPDDSDELYWPIGIEKEYFDSKSIKDIDKQLDKIKTSVERYHFRVDYWYISPLSALPGLIVALLFGIPAIICNRRAKSTIVINLASAAIIAVLLIYLILILTSSI